MTTDLKGGWTGALPSIQSWGIYHSVPLRDGSTLQKPMSSSEGKSNPRALIFLIFLQELVPVWGSKGKMETATHKASMLIKHSLWWLGAMSAQHLWLYCWDCRNKTWHTQITPLDNHCFIQYRHLTRATYHIVSRQQLLQELCLFVLNCFNDEFVIAGHVEDGTTGPRVEELNEWLIAEWVLRKMDERAKHKVMTE